MSHLEALREMKHLQEKFPEIIKSIKIGEQQYYYLDYGEKKNA